MARVKVIVTVSDGSGRIDSGRVVDVDEATAELWKGLGYVEDAPEEPAEGSEEQIVDEEITADESGESESAPTEEDAVDEPEKVEPEEREQQKAEKQTATRRAPRTTEK